MKRLLFRVGGILIITAVAIWWASPSATEAALSQQQKHFIKENYRICRAIEHLTPALDPTIREYYAQNIYWASTSHNIDPLLIVAIIAQESGFSPLATSKAGCIGLMQINPRAHPNKTNRYKRAQLYHVSNNINLGTSILKEYYQGSTREALYKYYGARNSGYANSIMATYAELRIDVVE